MVTVPNQSVTTPLTNDVGIDFQTAGALLSDIEAVKQSPKPVSITINGHAVREVPGPNGLPLIG